MTKLTQDTRAVRAGLENCDVTGAKMRVASTRCRSMDSDRHTNDSGR